MTYRVRKDFLNNREKFTLYSPGPTSSVEHINASIIIIKLFNMQYS